MARMGAWNRTKHILGTFLCGFGGFMLFDIVLTAGAMLFSGDVSISDLGGVGGLLGVLGACVILAVLFGGLCYLGILLRRSAKRGAEEYNKPISTTVTPIAGPLTAGGAPSSIPAPVPEPLRAPSVESPVEPEAASSGLAAKLDMDALAAAMGSAAAVQSVPTASDTPAMGPVSVDASSSPTTAASVPDPYPNPDKPGAQGGSLPPWQGYLTGQLIALYKQSHDAALRDEYLRRLQKIGLSEQEAMSLFMFEVMIIKHDAIERLASPDYLQGNYFDLSHVLLREDSSYYVEHQSFLCSEIVKIWDEAEWHYWNSHERDLPDEVWEEIYAISRYGGGKLFIDYLTMVAEKAHVPMAQVQAYTAAEQQLLFAYKWNPGKGERDPYA